MCSDILIIDKSFTSFYKILIMAFFNCIQPSVIKYFFIFVTTSSAVHVTSSLASELFHHPIISRENDETLLRIKRQDLNWPPPLGSENSDNPQITDIQVQCDKSHIRVQVEFDRPFNGIIFSKGHYSNPSCIHLNGGTGTRIVNFDVFMETCGMRSSGNTETNGQPNPAGSYIENTIIIQYDPIVQEVWDQARKLRCTWYDFYEKSVTFKPFQVDPVKSVTANFLGDNLQCWMQIQAGKGPFMSEVSGIVKIGQTMTMVLGIKDPENKFDMLVRNCVAHDGNSNPIQLVDDDGCIVRSKIMGNFQKMKNFGQSATVVSYAFFQAFKFPDSMNVHFQCVIQVCRFNCPEPVCSISGAPQQRGVDGGSARTIPPPPTLQQQTLIEQQSPNLNPFLRSRRPNNISRLRRRKYNQILGKQLRRKRSANETEEVIDTEGLVPITEKIRVINGADLAITRSSDFKNNKATFDEFGGRVNSDDICLSLLSFTMSTGLLLMVMVTSSITTFITCGQLNKKVK